MEPKKISVSGTRLIEECICGCRQWVHVKGLNAVPTMACAKCGIMAQRIDQTEDELEVWYREKYQGDFYTHDIDHDREVAKKRIKAYGPKLRGRVLDVGCGNGAFVVECIEKGIDCEGQDLFCPLTYEWIHQGDLFDLNFPTEHYDTITCHDVLEHVPDPWAFLKELQRMLKPGGWFILDFPDFKFKHHWKVMEHLWMLNLDQVNGLLQKVKFIPRYWTRPIDSKMVFHSTKGGEKRTTILVPPGIGDSYWSVVKLPGMIKAKGLGLVDIYVSDADGKQRSLPLIKKLPWAKGAGYIQHKVTAPQFQEAYMRNGRYCFEGVQGCDYFVAFNGVMRFGADLDKVESGWESEWFPRMFHSPDEKIAEKKFSNKFGKFVVAYFVEHGMYGQWLGQMNPLKIRNALIRVKEAGYQIVFMGAKWDVRCLHSQLALEVDGVDLAGQTNLDEMLALIRASSGVMGWPAGNTIMATVLKKQTVMWWNTYFHRAFWAFSCPPESRGDWYHWHDTGEFDIAQVDAFLDRL